VLSNNYKINIYFQTFQLNFLFLLFNIQNTNLSNETAQSAIILLETILKNPKTLIKENNLQLLTMGCILVSSKVKKLNKVYI